MISESSCCIRNENIHKDLHVPMLNFFSNCIVTTYFQVLRHIQTQRSCKQVNICLTTTSGFFAREMPSTCWSECQSFPRAVMHASFSATSPIISYISVSIHSHFFLLFLLSPPHLPAISYFHSSYI